MSNLATTILEQNWNRKLPVDPVRIATRLGVEVYARGGPADPNYTMSGRFYFKETTPVIEYNSTESPQRQRMMVAHQLGHLLLKHKTPLMENDHQFEHTEGIEFEATQFAINLLMPAVYVQNYYNSCTSSLEQLASIFGVSKDALGHRIYKLINKETTNDCTI